MLTALQNTNVDVETVAERAQTVQGAVQIRWVKRTLAVPCRIRQLKGDERVASGKESVLLTHRFYFTGEVGIQPQDDRLVDPRTGRIFNVVRVNDVHGMGDHLEVDTVVNE